MIFTDINNLTYLLNKSDSTATIIESYNARDDICIPISVRFEQHDYIIKSIGERSFFKNCDISSIYFQEHSCVEKIEKKAFSNSYLSSIEIPSSVTEIGEKAFSECNELYDVEIPKDSNLAKIGKEAFFCSSIERIFIPKKVTEICEETFYSCSDLHTVEIPEDSELKCIGKGAFSWSSVITLCIPKNLEKLEKDWCYSARCLDSLLLSKSNKNFKMITINDDDNDDDCVEMVVGKSDINSVDFDTLVFVNRDAQNVKVPKEIKRIESCAFSGCSLLKTVIFEENSELISIENDAFAHSSLCQITIPSKTVRIGSSVFGRCECLQNIEFQKDSCLESIGKNVFSYSSIKSFNIPRNLYMFDKGWCVNAFCLNDVFVSQQNRNISILDSKILLRKSDTKSEIFDEIIFACRDIKEAKIPSYIKYIKSCAFLDCTHLETVEFEENSSLVSIEGNAFSNTSIKRISIPKHVEFIGKNAFNRCYKLEKIEIPEDSELKTIKKFAFNETLIDTIFIPSKVERLKSRWCALAPNLEHVVISPENRNIKYAGANNEMIVGKSDISTNCFDILLFANKKCEKFVIPSYVKHLNGFVFNSNDELKEVEFEEKSSLISVGVAAFRLTNIENLYFPDNTKVFENRICEKCSMLFSVEFLADELVINGYCFSGCFDISIIAFPNAKKISLAYDFLGFEDEFDDLLVYIRPLAIINYFPSDFE